ncbi:TetR/AcrR family transcriptional regulator [Tenacibaculum agarivorans]|uniref:TetR/AcrR family transcriptional regulator n=1 Tax=Tenacibaculum agarivorans TaxID=1908389 RepID=UPI00094B8EF1|nr:TetR/AcrR family transcriptional regulator [Tenacibaculum agarivorans]
MPKTETFDKELVIQQVTEVFHSKSYSLTSMQDLVDATGLNRSSIYNTFGSKLDLYMLCLKSYQCQAQNEIQNILCSNENDCYIKTLERIFYTNINDKKGCLINNCTTEMANQEDSINSFLKSNNQGMIALFQDIIEKGQERGSINTNKTAYEYAIYLVTTFQGFSLSNILINDQKDMQSIVKTILSVLE